MSGPFVLQNDYQNGEYSEIRRLADELSLADYG